MIPTEKNKNSFVVIPAIDLKEGRCVRLKQGDMNQADVYGEDPVAMAQRWKAEGARRLHLVDLNGAFAGLPQNEQAVLDIRAKLPDLPIQIGGGIRTFETAERYFNAGVKWCIIGSKAIQSFGFLIEATQHYPNQIILGLDARNGYLSTEGWAETSDIHMLDFVERCNDLSLGGIVYTDIARDGMLSGANITATHELAKNSQCGVIASGGIKNLEDIKQLAQKRSYGLIGAITGRAIYTGALDFAKAQKLADEQC